ncbi:MAG: hypothetical protein M3065_15035 [Actinomycetota bacterium]|nr:hypothetical protein [Actinomycetota bacterium]
MDLTRLGVALAAKANVPLTEGLAIGTLTARVGDPQSAPDLGLSLIEMLAYIGDVLSAEQDQLADEDFLETSREGDEDVVRLRFLKELLPAVFVAVGEERAFVVVIGSRSGDSTVRFGDGEPGTRPPMGLEDVSASYRQGGGNAGCLELCGLRLGSPCAVIAISHRATRAGGFICSIRG